MLILKGRERVLIQGMGTTLIQQMRGDEEFGPGSVLFTTTAYAFGLRKKL